MAGHGGGMTMEATNIMSHPIRFHAGDKVRTINGRITIVIEQGVLNNCMVLCEDGRWYHPTKVWRVPAHDVDAVAVSV